jgi:hypothetical protein
MTIVCEGWLPYGSATRWYRLGLFQHDWALRSPHTLVSGGRTGPSDLPQSTRVAESRDECLVTIWCVRVTCDVMSACMTVCSYHSLCLYQVFLSRDTSTSPQPSSHYREYFTSVPINALEPERTVHLVSHASLTWLCISAVMLQCFPAFPVISTPKPVLILATTEQNVHLPQPHTAPDMYQDSRKNSLMQYLQG